MFAALEELDELEELVELEELPGALVALPVPAESCRSFVIAVGGRG